MNEFPNSDLSPAAVRLLSQLISNLPPISREALSIESAIRYVCGALDAAGAEAVEEQSCRETSDRKRLVTAFDAVAKFRDLTLSEVRSLALSGSVEAEYAAAYLEVATEAAEPANDGLVSLLQKGANGARAALAAIQAGIQASSSVPRLAGTMRSYYEGVVLEGEGDVEVLPQEDGLDLRFIHPQAERCFVSLETPIGRIRLCVSEIRDGVAHVPCDEDVREAGSLVVRVDGWPQGASPTPLVCCVGKEPSPPFARIDAGPTVRGGEFSLVLSWLDDHELSGPGELEVSFGTGPDQWQRLGVQPVAAATGSIGLRFEFPGPDQAFNWPIKLIWRPVP